MMSRHFRLLKIGLYIAGLAIVAGVFCFYLRRPTPQVWFQRGLESVTRGDWPAVLQSAERLKNHKECAAQEHLLRGIHLLKTNRPTAALKEFGRLEPKGELRELSLLYAGEAFYRIGQLAESQRLLAMLSYEQPGHIEAHRWLAAIAYDLGAMQRAIEELEIVMRLDPSDYRPSILQGHIYSDMERFSAAVTAYSQAVSAKPPDKVLDEVLPALARAQMQVREYAAALETLASAQTSAENLSLEAECRLSLGDRDEAERLIRKAQEMDPSQLDVLRLLGRMEVESGHAEAALEPLNFVLKRDPHDHESRYQLAQALRLLSKQSESEAESRKASETIAMKVKLAELTKNAIARPTDADVREQMAVLCDSLGKRELANSWRKAAAACRKFAPATTPAGSSSQ